MEIPSLKKMLYTFVKSGIVSFELTLDLNLLKKGFFQHIYIQFQNQDTNILITL